MGGLFLVSGTSSGAEPALPRAAIQPAAKNFVTICGEVMRQGRYPLNVNMAVPQVLQLAGGPTARAKLTQVKLIRKTAGGSFTIDVNLGGAGAGAAVVRPGDVIIVDEVLTDF
jgi:protein involved in polysaccharide export with SLBB domain